MEAGTVAELPIGEAAGEAATAVSLDSDVPVTASVRVVDTLEDKAPDLAYTAATAPLAGPTPALLGVSNKSLATSLLVTAVGELPARVHVRSVLTDSSVAEEQTVDVPGRSTVVVPVTAAPDSSWTTVIVDPAEPGTVAATREIVGSDDAGELLVSCRSSPRSDHPSAGSRW